MIFQLLLTSIDNVSITGFFLPVSRTNKNVTNFSNQVLNLIEISYCLKKLYLILLISKRKDVGNEKRKYERKSEN